MFTAKFLGDSINKQERRRVVTVEFSDGSATYSKDFSFSLNTDTLTMRKTVKQYLDEINLVPATIATGVDTFSDIQPDPVSTPTAQELARQAWEADWNTLQKVDQLIAAGILTGSEKAVTNLRDKVKTDFKPAYL